jgi:hypothetical protein
MRVSAVSALGGTATCCVSDTLLRAMPSSKKWFTLFTSCSRKLNNSLFLALFHTWLSSRVSGLALSSVS